MGLEAEIWAWRLGGRRRGRRKFLCVEAYVIDPIGGPLSKKKMMYLEF